MNTKTGRLRALMGGDKAFIAADCYSVLTGRIAERIGFEALYVGGHSLGVMQFGLPDYSILAAHEMAEEAGRIAASVDIPVIADADELGETVANIHRAIGLYERAGVAGIHVEDEIPPKHATFRSPLRDVEEMQARISCAVAARSDPEFVIIARTNELVNRMAYNDGSLEEAIKRGCAYAEAGVDAVVVPGATRDEHRLLADALPVPYAAFSEAIGRGDGIKLVLSTGWATNSAGLLYERLATQMYESGGTLPPEAFKRYSHAEEMFGEPAYREVISRWVEKTGRNAGDRLEARMDALAQDRDFRSDLQGMAIHRPADSAL